MGATLNADALSKIVTRAVRHELKFYKHTLPFPVRRELFDRAHAEALSCLSQSSTKADARRVARTTTRRVLDGNTTGYFKQVEVPFEEDDFELNDGDDSSPVDLGTGIFGGCSLHARRMKGSDGSAVEDEIIARIDMKRRLAKFIEKIGVETWRWFLNYAASERKPNDIAERVRFHRLKTKFLIACNNGQVKAGIAIGAQKSSRTRQRDSWG